jgi:hypothetical protein
MVAAFAIGGLAGARSLSNDEALPPATENVPVSPFVDTWTTTDADARTRRLMIRAAGGSAYEITMQNNRTLVCAGASSTVTGTARLVGATRLVMTSPEITCNDGTEANAEGFLLDDVFADLTFEHDPESDVITYFAPFERRRSRPNAGDVYTGLDLVWGRADAENRIGEVGGWITYGDGSGLWARDLSSPGDPSDRVRLSSTPGTPIAWSSDGSKLLVQRDYTDLYVISSDGTETQLTDSGFFDGGSFSPDGAAVVYADRSTIKVVDAEGGSPEVLLTSGIRQFPDGGRFKTALQEANWAPDGSKIAYFDGMGDWGHSLRVVDSDGTNSHVVVENDKTLGAGHVYGLEWSPDGRRLAFSIEDRIYVVGVDGSGFRQVADNGTDPYWSPDGSHIAYTRPDPNRPQRGSLEIVRLDDLRVRNFGPGASGPWTAEAAW